MRITSVTNTTRPRTYIDNSTLVRKVLNDVQSAKLLDMHYSTNIIHRIDSQLSITNSERTLRNIDVTWDFKQFNNEEGNIRVSLKDRSGKNSYGLTLAAKDLPDPIKEALITRLAAKNPTGSHSLAEGAAKPEVQRFLTELKK